MRVLQVVAVLSDDGAFGGPVTVAETQCSELRRRGHDVTLAALWRSAAGSKPIAREGVALHRARTVVPRVGLLGMHNPRLLLRLWREVGRCDAVHVHCGRDLVSLSALVIAGLRRKRTIAQTHGMVPVPDRWLSKLFDIALLPLLRRCAAVFYLTEHEFDQLRVLLGGEENLRQLDNCIPVLRQGSRNPSARVGSATVLFLARLHPRKRVEAFAEMAALCRTHGVPANFVVHGPDEGSLGALREKIANLDLEQILTYGGPLDHSDAVRVHSRADVYVLPSIDEPFPMSLLESLALGVPSVCTDSCGIAEALRRRGAALVTDGSPEELAAAVARLVRDDQLRVDVAAAGLKMVRERFSTSAVIGRLLMTYGATPPKDEHTSVATLARPASADKRSAE